MSELRELKDRFMRHVDRVQPKLPPETKYTIVVPKDYYDRYSRSLLYRDRYHDVDTPSENLLWEGHVIVRGQS